MFYLPTVLGAELDSTGMYVGPRITRDSAGNALSSMKGTPVPDHVGAFTLKLTLFKNLTIYGQTDWGIGGSIFNQTRQFNNNTGFGTNSQEKRKLAVQLQLADSNQYGDIGVKPLALGSAEYKAAADQYARLETGDETRANWIESSDFLSIRELSISYNATDLLTDLIGDSYIKNIALTLSAHNLALFTKYSGADPQVNDSGAETVEQSTDFLTLQSPRAYNLSLQLGF